MTYRWRLSIKYDPNQPRVPAGSSTGGQWAGTGAGTSFEAGPYKGYRLSGGQKLPEHLVAEDATVMRSPEGDLIVVPGHKVAHANIVAEMGDTARFDEYVRGDVLKRWTAKTGIVPVLHVDSQTIGAGTGGGPDLDLRAQRRLSALARAMLAAGYPASTAVEWRVAGGDQLEDLTLDDFKAVRDLGWWAGAKYNPDQPKGPSDDLCDMGLAGGVGALLEAR